MISSGAFDFAAKFRAKHCSFVIPEWLAYKYLVIILMRGERTCNTVNSSLTRKEPLIRCRYPSDVVLFINLSS